VACKNPLLEAERARKRESLLTATEADLGKIAAATQRARRPLRGKDKIALRAPILFTDDDKAAAEATRRSPVAPPSAPREPWPRQLPSAPRTTFPCTASTA
jgi:hypothetical protein